MAVSILATGALCDLAGPLPTVLVVAAVTFVVTAATGAARHTGQTWRSPVRDS